MPGSVTKDAIGLILFPADADRRRPLPLPLLPLLSLPLLPLLSAALAHAQAEMTAKEAKRRESNPWGWFKRVAHSLAQDRCTQAAPHLAA